MFLSHKVLVTLYLWMFFLLIVFIIFQAKLAVCPRHNKHTDELWASLKPSSVVMIVVMSCVSGRNLQLYFPDCLLI